ncbi:MAG TPA: hypothetical protein VK463_02820 [Desulfomonilaceae bacterium]|nr:hypothetical protein [Desulfomonilaceae bacterium]
MRNESFLAQSSASPQMKRGSLLLKIAALAVFLLWNVSCVPVLMGKKEPGTGKTGASGSGLIKPKLAHDSSQADGKSNDGSRNATAPEKREKLEKPVISAAEASEKPEKLEQKTAQVVAKELVTPSVKEQTRTETPLTGKEPGKQLDPGETGTKASGSGAEPAKQFKDGVTDPDTDLTKVDTSFKKHDHSKYTEKIRNKAIDRVNQEPTCKYARICRDSTTDEWGLTLYYVQDKVYVMVSYAWDDIDQKFEKSFTSDKRPVSGWKHHLDFSAAGKECRVLKGARP